MNQQTEMTMQVPDRPANEVFALTDEQILGIEAEGQEVGLNPWSRERANDGRGPSAAAATVAGSAPIDSAQSRRDDRARNDDGNAGENNRGKVAEGLTPEGVSYRDGVASRYREFERATNAELEKSVGGAIARAMEAALPNLRQIGGEGQAPPLQERLRNAVKEEVESALRSDASLGEQVARVLSGRRFDEAARAQVVRLIDARAQQLVPGAVRRVVGSWTQATLGARKPETGAENTGRGSDERRVERAPSSSQRTASGNSGGDRNAQTAAARGVPRGRVDYRKMSDEQILGM